MGKSSEPTYVSGTAPHLKIQPPIVHPEFCVCQRCSKLAPEERSREHTFRIYRASKYPASMRQSIIFAADVKRDLERDLVAARDAALQVASVSAAEASRAPLEMIGVAYLAHQERNGGRADRNRYTVDALVRHFGPRTDPAAITKTDHAAYVEKLRGEGFAPDTIGRHTRILLAMLNSAVRDGLVAAHQLHGVRRPIVKRTKKPVTFSPTQLDVLRGKAMDRWEAELRDQIEAHDPKTGQHAPTMVPLRGFCLVAYRTLMRPGNNFGLEWSQLAIDERRKTGVFRLDDHKNVSRGVEVEAAIHRELVEYLITLRRSANGARYVHPNPETGLPYRNIVRHWKRLCEIANEILVQQKAAPLRDEQLHFYTWRHTGATRLAESGGDPVAIVRMMGDVDLETVMEHYFGSSLEHMQKMMDRWD